MNILFQTCGKLNPTAGGTERTTITVATALKEHYGCRCYSIYEREAPSALVDCIEDEYLWTVERDEARNAATLRRMIEQWHIDVIIVQGAFIHVKRFRSAIQGLNCRLILAHHFEPGWEVVFFSLGTVLNHKPHSWRQACRWIYNFVLFPYARRQYINLLAQQYREAYENADRVVLLSKVFIQPYQKFGRFQGEEKFRIIPNGLSLTEFFPREKLSEKQNLVLIVSRLDDPPKKISVALEIWRRVKMHAESNGWRLQIVGEGPDGAMYRKIVARRKIPDVEFMGRQVPNPYYRKAAIFMMTSRSESWGLTLTEAQQMGVVPIAFDTYPSLKDIITDGYDGVIVPKWDLEDYVNKMLALMSSPNRRQELATNGLQSCLRFAPEKVVEKWWQLIDKNI
jgi:glycosyltransferase involved in cell wall biosynthesis